jgi:DNA polymerase IV
MEGAPANWPLADKKAFYAELEALSNDDDDNDDFSEGESGHRSTSRTFRLAPVPDWSQSQLQAPRRTLSAPLPNATPVVVGAAKIIRGTPIDARSTPKPRNRAGQTVTETLIITDTPLEQRPRANGNLQRPASSPLSLSTVPADTPTLTPASFFKGTAKKRKRSGLTNQLEPPRSQLFAGLAFFYVPNDDRNKVRKLRIAKAKEHGAAWVRQVRLATHVIVDKDLVWKDIEPILKGASLEGVRVVSDEWPTASVSLGELLDAFQIKYRVPGQPALSASSKTDKLATDAASGTDSSLSLGQIETRPHRWDYNVLRGTPPRSEQTSGGNGIPDEGGATPADVSIIPSSQPEQRIQGAEELAIETVPSPSEQTESLSQKDELAGCISEMQRLRDLPLEEDDDADAADEKEQDVGDDTLDEIESPDLRLQKRRHHQALYRNGRKNLTLEERFACFTGGKKDEGRSNGNPNARTIEILQQLCDYYIKTNDHWRQHSYRKAINILKRQTVKITSEEQAMALPTIGPRLAKKIEEIVTTDQLRRLEHAKQDATSIAFDRFYKIYGVGSSQANKWIAQGFKTLEDLQEGAKLNVNQRIGIEHYDDLNTRIPRAEVTALGDYVKGTAKDIDSAVELLVGGSYRRGSDSSGDIDFIVTKKGTQSAEELLPFLERLVSKLTETGFLVATLASFHSVRMSKPDSSGSKWHGCCILPREVWEIANPSVEKEEYRPIWRRIDFLLVPETEYGAALIYFTGNDIFNRSIRLLASKKGMRLNQRGLYRDVLGGPNRTKLTLGHLLEGRSEKRIFEILGVQWRPPHERRC